MTNNTELINYVETLAIPDLNERKMMGYSMSAICVGWQYDTRDIIREVEKRTNYKGTACGGTIYFKLK